MINKPSGGWQLKPQPRRPAHASRRKSNAHFMESTQPEFDPEKFFNGARSLIDRMARAKWITGTNAATWDQFYLSLTKLGQQRCGVVSDAFINVAPEFFRAADTSVLKAGSIRQPSHKELLAVIVLIAPVVSELLPPKFSNEEWELLFGFFASYSRTKALGAIPPNRDSGPSLDDTRPPSRF
jgi:hypothetical protein